MTRTLVLLNRRSGTLKDLWHDNLVAELRGWLAGAGLAGELEVLEPAALDARLARAAGEGWERVIVGGGDGTIASAAQHLQHTNIPLGILPLGTLNLAARDIGMPLDLQAAIQALARAVPTPVDVLEVNGRPCLCVTILGFYPAMQLQSETYHGQRWWVKAAQLVIGTVRSFTKFAPLQFELRSEAGHWRITSRFAVFANNSYEDVLGILPRKTSLDQGFLTAYVSGHQTLGAIGRGALAYLFGRVRRDPGLLELRARELTVRARRRKSLPIMIDGEILREHLPLVLRIRPAALRLLVPPAPAA